jgi:enoyl-CoA hydratase / 3-hydroxyacyl-CoA dehydrogenase
MSTATDSVTGTLVERLGLKTIVESCLVLEDGIASLKDIEIGMMTGAGILPGPFSRADEQGLDEVLAALERAQREYGDSYAPPKILRRLVGQGRLGKKSGQGFFPYPQPDPDGSKETILFETRGDIGIVWFNRPPANPLAPQVIRELSQLWQEVDGKLRVLVFASSNIFTFSAGADIKEFVKADPAEGKEISDAGHALFRGMEESSTITIASVNSIAFGGGCELAMSCDFRIAAESATFGQPEINLGIIPGFGGTQRLPRLVGEGKALEMNLTGTPIGSWEALRLGLVNQVVADHELFDTAIAWARKLAGQAPLSVQRIKQVTADPALDAGIEAEIDGFLASLGSEDGREGVAAFLEKRAPQWRGA